MIRVNPVGVHVYDPDCYDLTYTAPTQKRDKGSIQAENLGLRHSMIRTLPHDLHRKRRAVLSPHFSPKSIAEFSPFIRAKVQQLVMGFKQAGGNGEILNMNHVFAAFSSVRLIILRVQLQLDRTC